MRSGRGPVPWRHLSDAGLVLGTLFFIASLTPTLIPRTALAQGLLSGVCFAAGYAIGIMLGWLWDYLELPVPRRGAGRLVHIVVAGLCLIAAAVLLFRADHWQNSVRQLMGLPPVTGIRALEIAALSVATFLVLVVLGRLFLRLIRLVAGVTGRILPRRLAHVLGVAVAVLLFWSIANGVFFRAAMRVADASFREADSLIPPDSRPPEDPLKTGSPASLIAWDELGRTGRDYVSSGPSAGAIRALTGREAVEPIRVYAGLPAGESARDRARLALEELKRVDAFSREALIVITPTGTGWVDPAAIDSIEFLYRGNVASVAQQYSYLASPLSLLVEPEYGGDAARALFREVYEYWTTLPRDHRPKLYLHGLSLGAMNSERSAELFELLDDPIQGALWSGPPFDSIHWRAFTEGRNLGSPAWLPQVRNGAFVRFMNQNGTTVPAGTPWGPMRIVYLQYASDPITFFDVRDLYRAPDWMAAPRGPDVSPELGWYPVVSMLQLGLDMMVSTATPVGYGHVFAPQHYIDAWLAVTGVDDWSPEQIDRLKQHFTGR
jgi:uncharacterized membrane protein